MVLRQTDQIVAPNFEAMPNEMKKLNQWIMWRAEPKSDGNWTKVPYQVNGYRASSTDPSHWSSFQEVKATYYSGGFAGVGFVFTKESGIVGIDVDNVDVNNLEENIELLTFGSFTEISVSGNGLHLYVKGEKIEGMPSKSGNYECYDENRFFVVTGNNYNGVPDVLEGQHIINKFSDLYLPVKKEYTHNMQPVGVSNELSDSDIVSLLERFKPKSMKVYQGDFSDYPSQSEAVLGLLNDLAFYTGRNATQMESIFMSSSATYENPKENTRKMIATINTAIQGTRNTYVPKRQGDNVIPFEAKHSIVEKEEASWWLKNPNGTRTLLHNVFAEYLMKEYSIVKYPNDHSNIHVYNKKEGIYQEDLSGRLLKSLIRDEENSLRLTQIYETVEYIKDQTKVIKQINKEYIAANNGLVDVLNMELIPFTPEIFITNKIKTNFNKDASNDFIVETINKVANYHKPTIANIHEMIACTIYEGILVPKMFVLYGKTALNGKSSILNMIRYAFDREGGNISAVTLENMFKDKFAGSAMVNKKANLIDDGGDVYLSDTAMFKSITTGGLVEVQAKGVASYSTTITATIIIATNHLLKMKEHGRQINRRICYVVCDYDFGADPNLLSDAESEKLLKEEGAREYVLLIAIRTLKRMLENPNADKLTYNEKSEEFANHFAEYNDPMSDYHEEFGKAYLVDTRGTRVYEDYTNWATENGIKAVSLANYKEMIFSKYDDLVWKAKLITESGLLKTVKGFK